MYQHSVLPQGWPDSQSLRIVGMNLHRKLFVREKKLQQQRKPSRVARRLAHEFALIFFAQLRECFPVKRPVRDFAVVSAQPRLADLLLELVIGINRRQILRAPGTRIKPRKHQQWIKISHAKLVPKEKGRPQKRPLANGTASAEPD